MGSYPPQQYVKRGAKLYRNMFRKAGVAGSLFEDDYSSSTGWNKVGSGSHAISSGKFIFGTGQNTADRRFWKDMGVTLPNTAWVAKFDIMWTAQKSNANETVIFALMEGSGQPLGSGSGDGIMVTQSSANYYLYTKLGTTKTDHSSSGQIIDQAANVTWYATLERVSATSVTLKMFSDSDRTIQQGSTITITINSSLGNLTHLHHGNSNPIRTNDTYINYQIDNTIITEE